MSRGGADEPVLVRDRDRLGRIRYAGDKLESRIELDGLTRALCPLRVYLRDQHADRSVGEDRHLCSSRYR